MENRVDNRRVDNHVENRRVENRVENIAFPSTRVKTVNDIVTDYAMAVIRSSSNLKPPAVRRPTYHLLRGQPGPAAAAQDRPVPALSPVDDNFHAKQGTPADLGTWRHLPSGQ